MSKDLRSNHLFLKFIVCIIILLFSTSSYAANVTASWNAPTTNEDQSSLSDLAGYKIYYGLASGNYTGSINAGNVTTYQINNLVGGLTYYFAVTAQDTSGNESIYSEEQSFTLPLPPPPPPPPAPDIAVSDSISPTGDLQIPFGDISEGNSAQQTITVTNEGDANLIIGSIAQNNPLADPFSILNDSCSGQTISPSSNCTFQVVFSPSTSDTFNDSFDIPSNDPDENPLTVTISGNVLAVPFTDIRVSDSIGNQNDQQMPFGNVSAGNSSQHTVTLTNEGNANLVMGSIAQNNPLADPFHILNDSCSGQTISPSSNCTFNVNFFPSSSGYASDSFDIPSNDADENPVTMNVTGNGTPPPTPDISVTDSNGTADDLQMPFGNVTEGVLSDQTVTVTNSGNANLMIGNIAQSDPLSAPFSILSDYCSGKTIAPSSISEIVVSNLSVGSGRSYEVVSNGLAVGEVVYIDRGYTYTSVPSSLQGATYIKTANDDKNSTGPSFVTFDVNQSVTVYVAHSVRITPKPSWLTSWTDTSEDLVTSGPNHHLYKKNFAAGTVVLGGNEGSYSSMYSIIIVDAGGTSNCTFAIRFAPSTVATFNDTFDIPSNDPDENPVAVSISGSGLSSIENNPPDDPVLVYPARGQRGLGKKVGMKWKKSKDPDGDLVTYDLQICQDQSMTTGCITEVNLVSIGQNDILYAGIGSYGAGLLFLLIVPALIGAIRQLNRKAFLIIGIVLIAGMLIVSCGGGDGGGSGGSVVTSKSGSGTSDVISDVRSDEISHELSGLNSATTYYWTVTAKDGAGGESSSEVRSFETE
jgi:hypothetical protein